MSRRFSVKRVMIGVMLGTLLIWVPFVVTLEWGQKSRQGIYHIMGYWRHRLIGGGLQKKEPERHWIVTKAKQEANGMQSLQQVLEGLAEAGPQIGFYRGDLDYRSEAKCIALFGMEDFPQTPNIGDFVTLDADVFEEEKGGVFRVVSRTWCIGLEHKSVLLVQLQRDE